MSILPKLWHGLLYTSLGFAALWVGTAHAGDNLITKTSKYSVPETIDRIEKAMTEKGMKIFTRIDHVEKRRKLDWK